MKQPEPSEFLLLPFREFDLFVVYRAADISRPFYVNYTQFIKAITASITPASALLLQTNGVNNPTQSLLNLVAGTNMTITDDGLGNITFDATGSGPYTVNNGLTENPANNFQLGGALIQNTTVDATSAFYMRFTGAKSGKTNQTLEAINTGNGFAFLAQALSAPSAGAIRVLTNGVGISIEQSVQGFDIQQSGGASVINLSNASNNTVDPVLILGRLTNIPPLVGSGGSVQINLNSASTPNSAVLGGIFGFELTSLSPSEETKYFCSVSNGGIPQRVHEVFTTGQHRFNKYGLNTFAGTPAYALGVDASGNVIEFTTGGGGLNETTGILFGGVLTATIGGTTFNLTAGIGQIVTQTASITGIVTTVNNVTWSAVTAVPITNIGTSQFTYILVNSAGTVIQQTTPFTDAQYKTHIIIGILCHIDFASVNLVTNTQNVAYQDPYRLVEIIRLFGPIKKKGMVIKANGPNLRVDRTAGEVFKIGSNYTTAAFEPDVDTISAATPAQLCRVHRDGSGGFVFDTFGGLYYSDIDPQQWDDGTGPLQPVPSNRWTVQRLFMFPNNPNDIICYYGIQLYNNFSEARAGVEFETFDEAQITAENAVFLGYLFVRHNATDLSDPNEAAFLQAGLFRGIPPGGGGSGGGGSVLTDDSIQGDGTLGNEIKLFNDTASPGVNKVYGTDSSGVRAWKDDPVTPVGLIAGSCIGTFYYRLLSYGHLIVPSTDRLFVPSNTFNIVDVFEASTGELLGTVAITAPFGAMFVGSLNEVWVSSSLSSTITRLDPSTFSVLGTFTVSGAGANEYVEVSPTKFYIANSIGNTIDDIDPSTLTVTATITSASIGLGVNQIFSICYVDNILSLHNGYIVGVSNNSTSFYAIDSATNTVVIPATNLGGTVGLASRITYNPVNDRYYWTLTTNHIIQVFEPDTPTTAVLSTRYYISFPFDIKCDISTGRVYCSSLNISTNRFSPMNFSCISTNGIEWAIVTPVWNNNTSTFISKISLDTVNKFAYCCAYTSFSAPQNLPKIKI